MIAPSVVVQRYAHVKNKEMLQHSSDIDVAFYWSILIFSRADVTCMIWVGCNRKHRCPPEVEVLGPASEATL